MEPTAAQKHYVDEHNGRILQLDESDGSILVSTDEHPDEDGGANSGVWVDVNGNVSQPGRF